MRLNILYVTDLGTLINSILGKMGFNFKEFLNIKSFVYLSFPRRKLFKGNEEIAFMGMQPHV